MTLKEDLDALEFIPFKEILLQDNEEIKEIKSLYNREVEYLDFLDPIEFFIANYGIWNPKLRDVDVIKSLRNIRDNWDKDIAFFQNDLEYNLMMTINASLQLQRRITKHELLLVIKHILWAIDNRKWIEGPRAYLDWIANFFHLFNNDQKKKFDRVYKELGNKYGISKEEIKSMKCEESDFELPVNKIVLSKFDSENFDENEASFWGPEAYAQSVSTLDLDSKEKMKYFGGDIGKKRN